MNVYTFCFWGQNKSTPAMCDFFGDTPEDAKELADAFGRIHNFACWLPDDSAQMAYYQEFMDGIAGAA